MLARMLIGGMSAVMMVIAALWAWGHALQIADSAHRPEVLAWGVRLCAIALFAGAQTVLLTLVIGTIYRRRGLLDRMLRIGTSLVCSLALVSAIALALAGR